MAASPDVATPLTDKTVGAATTNSGSNVDGATSATPSQQHCRQHWLDLGEWASESSSKALATRTRDGAKSSRSRHAPMATATMLLPPDAKEEADVAQVSLDMLKRAPPAFLYQLVNVSAPSVQGLSWGYGVTEASGRCTGSILWVGPADAWQVIQSSCE